MIFCLSLAYLLLQDNVSVPPSNYQIDEELSIPQLKRREVLVHCRNEHVSLHSTLRGNRLVIKPKKSWIQPRITCLAHNLHNSCDVEIIDLTNNRISDCFPTDSIPTLSDLNSNDSDTKKELSPPPGYYAEEECTLSDPSYENLSDMSPPSCNDLKGMKLDYWVTGYGTGGTFHGAGKYIKENSPGTKIVLAEPGAANLIGSGISTERNADGSPAGSHPAFNPHPIQGWTPDFIPLVLEKGLDQSIQDEMVDIPDGAAVAMSQALAKNEGILTGISGGATMWAAIETAKKAPEGSVLVAMLPDTGERYLSTPLFASIEADMNEGELEIARSTPSFILEPSS
jgi:hypothetical protein